MSKENFVNLHHAEGKLCTCENKSASTGIRETFKPNDINLLYH